MKSKTIILAAMLACGAAALAKANATAIPADSISGEEPVRLWIKQSEKVGNVVQLFIQNRQRDTLILQSSFYVDDCTKRSHVLVYCCGQHPNYDSTECDWYSAPLEAGPLEYADGKLRIPPNKTFYLEIPVWDWYIGYEVYLKPRLWFLRNDEKFLYVATKETNRIYLKRLSVLPHGRYISLFGHVYKYNNWDDRDFQRQVRNIYDRNATLPINYPSIVDGEWINSWRICIANSLEISRGIFEKIQKAGANEKIGSMALREKGIYVGTFYVNDTTYSVAIYSERDTVDNLTKVQVSTLDELEKPGNRRYLLYDKDYRKYVIIAFYEEGVSEPPLIIQVEKPAARSQQSTLETWLRFLNILQAPEGR
jgi:hypothetical protein